MNALSFVLLKRRLFGELCRRLSGIQVGQTPLMNCVIDNLKTYNGQQACNFTVCVEGNIASGKTSLIEYYSEKADKDLEIWKEPVNKWRNVHGHNLLALFYEDPERWSMLLQSYVQLTISQISSIPQTKPIRLIERSIFSARYCFVENVYKSGKLSQVEYDILNEWFLWLTSYCTNKIDLIVYLQTRPETVYERIKKRGRREEMSIPLSYLQSLNELHEDWLIRRINNSWVIPAPVLVLDANQDLGTMVAIYQQHQKEILKSHAM